MKKRTIEEVVAFNLQKLMEEKPHLASNPKLAKLAHLGTGTISRIRNAETSASIGNLQQLADAVGITLEELIRNPDLPPLINEPQAHYMRSGIPVVGTAQLGDDGYWLEMEFPVGHGDGWVRYPARDPNAYALRCKGDSMRPRIKNGEFVVVEPNTPFKPGHDVLVRDKRGRAMVKVFNFERDGSIEVGSVNEDHKAITLTLEEIDKIHRVVAVLSPDAYYRDIV